MRSRSRPLATFLGNAVILAGCSQRPSNHPPADRTASADAVSSTDPGPVPPRTGFDRAYTGALVPSLVVKNEFPVTQHVFVDWVHRGELLPRSSRTFELTAGTHTITCADSRDPDRNPLAVTETFEAGFSYTYVVVPQ